MTGSFVAVVDGRPATAGSGGPPTESTLFRSAELLVVFTIAPPSASIGSSRWVRR
jgi:hypothetical protein